MAYAEDRQMIEEFLGEASENLTVIEECLLALERSRTDKTLVQTLFRSFHTIKGASAMFEFKGIEGLTHATENLLSLVRSGEIIASDEIIAALLKSGDATRTLIDELHTGRTEDKLDTTSIIDELKRLGAGVAKNDTPAKPAHSILTPDSIARGYAIFDEPDEIKPCSPPQPQLQAIATPTKSSGLAPAEKSVDVPPTSKPSVETSIRVNITHLDKLMNLVSEMVLSRNQMMSYLPTRNEFPQFYQACLQINAITTELQGQVMATRLQPIGNAWTKIPRMVHDLARSLQKKVELEMTGDQTELDRSMIESIKDPLMHIIRNAIDHGIESPDERVEVNKAETGRIKMAAYAQNGKVYIEINDDGAGIDTQKLGRKAVEKGLISEEARAAMSSHELLNLIFVAGFSTAKVVTNVSGRGVGMDVVRTNIEAIGGSVDIKSEAHKGSTFLLTIPLTLAISPGLFVRSNGAEYAIPQNSISELILVKFSQIEHTIEKVHGVPVIRLRGKLLPLIFLRQIMAGGGEHHFEPNRDVSVVILKVGKVEYGLVVDTIKDTQEIVVKPLGSHLSLIPLFGGITITGSGNIALILDPMGLADDAGLLAPYGKDNDASITEHVDEKATGRPVEGLLIVKGADDGRLALPLAHVIRLEKIAAKHFEQVGNGEAVQYRGSILPIVHLAKILPERRRKARDNAVTSGSWDLVVCQSDERTLGIVVPGIIDIVEGCFETRSKAARAGILENAVIFERITELVDMNWVFDYHAVNSSEVAV